MREEIKILTLLQVTVPSSTLLYVSAEVKILEILGIVSNPELVRAMNLSSSLVPPTTQATMRGLVQLLSSLIRMNPKCSKAQHASLNKLVASLTNTPDVALTFGSFLPICESLLQVPPKRHEQKSPHKRNKQKRAQPIFRAAKLRRKRHQSHGGRQVLLWQF